MIHRCPSCGYEPVDQSLICPNCGAEIVENVTEKLQHEENLQTDLSSVENKVDDSTVEVITFEDTDEVNDDIVWSDLQEQPIGEVMKELAKEHDVPLSKADLAAINITLSKEEQDNSEDNQSAQLADLVQEQQEKQKEAEDAALEENPILANYIEMHNAQKEAQRLAEQAENQQAESNVQEPQEVASQEKSNQLSDTEKSTNALADEVTEAEKNVYTAASNHILQDSVDNQEADEEQAKPSKKWRHLALAGAALLVVGGGFYYAHVQRQDTNKSQVTQKADSQLSKLSVKVTQLFTTNKAEFLKATVTLAQIDDLSNQLEKYKDDKGYTKLHQQLASAKQQWQKVSEVNGYFTSPIIENGQLKEQATLDYSQKFAVKAIANPQEPYEKLVNEAVAIGQKAYEQYEKAQSATKELMDGYKNQLLASSVTREKYQNAKKMVDQLAKSKQKESLSKQLATIDQALTKKEQEEKQAKAANTETSNQTEAVAEKPVEANPVNTQPIYTTRTSEQSEVLSPESVHQGDNQPLISTRLSDLQDVNNQAWQWNPEVKNQVLQACLSRGYIVDGGYVLERARIENQEGYYNLYAVAPSQRFSYASAKNPVYVVTINDKTGFYKGNGNDHTIR